MSEAPTLSTPSNIPCQSTNTCPGNENGIPEDKVRNFVSQLLDSLIDELMRVDGCPSITLKRRSNHSHFSLHPETGALQRDTTEPSCTYSWPGKTAQEAWRFAVLLRILGHISEAIRGDFISSKRDIYYLDPVYFGSQSVVDRCIDDIACTIGVDRTALHVAAAAKGVVGMLVPRVETVKKIDTSTIRWILVIEKEATFHRLATVNFHTTSAAGSGILITGKGYPDISTRAFLHLLSRVPPSASGALPFRQPPIFMLVDGDPDGMAIMSTYKYGSRAQAHDNTNLAVHNVQWLGLQASELVPSSLEIQGDDALIPLTSRDRKKAQDMLGRSPVFAEDGPEPAWRRELQHMLMTNVKAEIEMLYEREGGIETWLDHKLQTLI
ncbi:meiosis-specific topoisomerase Spo11 [Histoplasma capsulatum H143]|uniref:DNA topoisomerase (ATP-hydrolyzing) n=1 Tax=Ajellomyces capsulatus (strain H143) TaxID=544712 RepID=C6HEM1_AJECH|nr:meiosis-specific topoisomerase Spo11 [Histoplasma capsulatum H143]